MVPPLLPMILLGAAFVLVPAAMWPAVPLIVEKNRVGTAFGLMTMIQNVGLALFPWLNGRLRDADAQLPVEHGDVRAARGARASSSPSCSSGATRAAAGCSTAGTPGPERADGGGPGGADGWSGRPVARATGRPSLIRARTLL